MRYTLRIIIIIFMGVSLTVLSFSNSLTFKSLGGINEISPNPENMKMSYNLYFVGSDSLEIESREIKLKDNQFLTGITEQLVNGPKNKLLKSPFNYGGKIKTTEIRKSTLFLNLEVDTLKEAFWNDADAELYIWSLVNTYTEFENIMNVQILVDGKKIDRTIGEYNLNEPLMRNDSLINNNNPSSRVLEFINHGLVGEYAEGYKLISSDSRKLLDFKAFILFFDDYLESLSGYEEVFHYYQEVENENQVYLKFSNMDLDKDAKNKIEKFRVVKEDNRWYVDLADMINE
ncbi:MAG: GerMN domain-containing protein [Acidaminobacteraceae bacterium]